MLKTISKSIFIIAFACAVSSAVLANEVKLSSEAIRNLLNDKTFQQIKPTTKNIVNQTFQIGGVTNFTVNNQVQQGRWRVENNKYCSNWPPTTHWDCYDVLQSDKTVIFLSARGAQYVMMPTSP